MPKVKISEYSATANSNTDVASINIDEGCAPSGINNAIRAVMGHLKDFQQGTNGDPFNGPVNGTLGATTASTANVTTLTTSSTITHNGGTANGVAYLNGSKVLTTGSALVFDGTNLGLGVTPSAWASNAKALDIGTRGSLVDWSSSQQTDIWSNGYFNGTNSIYKTTANASIYRQSVGQHIWYNAPSGTAGNPISFTQAMTLDASGRLGIGTTSPSTPLQIQTTAATGVNSIFCTGSTTAFNFWTISNTSGQARIGVDSSSGGALATGSSAYSTVIGSTNATPLHLISNGAVGATIDTSGNLLVGTTSTNQSHRFIGKVQNAWTTEFFAPWASNNYGISVNYTAAAPNTTGFWFYYAGDTGGQRFGVASNGGISNYSANNINLSDRREKTNFAPAKSYLDVICAIPVQTFNYIDQNLEKDDGLTLGVVAQDVQAVAPELVTETNWANKDEDPKMRLSIYQTDLQYALMKCIQEQSALITQLTARITALESA